MHDKPGTRHVQIAWGSRLRQWQEGAHGLHHTVPGQGGVLVKGARAGPATAAGPSTHQLHEAGKPFTQDGSDSLSSLKSSNTLVSEGISLGHANEQGVVASKAALCPREEAWRARLHAEKTRRTNA